MARDSRHDVVIVGGGHNGLVAAAYLARAGRSVLVLERRDHVGGAAVSERPWPGVDARLSRYAYLVSLLPQSDRRRAGPAGQARPAADLVLHAAARPTRRAACWSTPRTASARRPRCGAAAGDPAAIEGWERLYATCARAARALWPTMTEPLRPAAELRALVGDDAAWAALVERPIGELIEDCLGDDALRGIALTDALIGTFAGAHDADLRQNRCFLYHVIGNGSGHWDVPMGGMGAVTAELEAAARAAGAELRCGAEVTAIDAGPAGVAVRFADAGGGGEQVAVGGHVLANVAPAVLDRLRGRAPSGAAPEGAQLKVNLLLARLPRLRDCAVDPADAFAGTFHVNEGYDQLERARAQAAAGALPDVVPCEIYCHSLTDPSILGPELQAAGAQTLTCFALHLPTRLFAADNDGDARARARGHPRVAGQRARRAGARLRVARRRRAPVRRGAHPARPRGRARAARRQHLPPRPRPGPSPRPRPRSAPGASRPTTRACSSAARAPAAAAGSAACRGATRRWPCWGTASPRGRPRRLRHCAAS